MPPLYRQEKASQKAKGKSQKSKVLRERTSRRALDIVTAFQIPEAVPQKLVPITFDF
jgi:hypothetical protein